MNLRWEREQDYTPNGQITFINCSEGCEKFARKKLGWTGKEKPKTPKRIVLDGRFGNKNNEDTTTLFDDIVGKRALGAENPQAQGDGHVSLDNYARGVTMN